MDKDMESKLLSLFPFLMPRESLDWPSFECPSESLLEVLATLRDDFNYKMLSDLTVLDRGTHADPRFEGIYHLSNLEMGQCLRLAVICLSASKPVLPSITSLWPAADWHERESYDMFGIVYEGHPDLKRILMWDEYPYHPLRKDFPLAGIETELPAEDSEEQSIAPVLPAPMMGGPFNARTGNNMIDREPRAKDQSWTEKDEARFRKEER